MIDFQNTYSQNSLTGLVNCARCSVAFCRHVTATDALFAAQDIDAE